MVAPRLRCRCAAALEQIFLRLWNMDEAPGIGADALVTEWLDDMVKKLKDELGRQLARAKETAEEANDARTRAADAVTLASLERTLERLARMEQARALVRETKIRREGARDALERRLDKLAAAGEKKKPA
jgi:hypothetical protein